MNKDEVPQDNSRTYGGHKKIIYATDRDGEYEKIGSSGWEAEELATTMAVDTLQQQARDAFERAKAGKTAPLEYHMFSKRLDVLSLSQATGFFQWQIRRHFNPEKFNRLSPKKIARYCEVLGLDPTTLKTLPPSPEQEIDTSL